MPRQADLLKGTGFVGDRIGEGSIFSVLHRDGHFLFPEDMFADLYKSTGRRSVPPQIVAAVMVSARRVLDATPVYDAVATQDTVTMIRSALRQLLAAADIELEVELRAVLARDDDYRAAGKPACDWDDAAAREQLVAGLAADAHGCLAVIDGRNLDGEVERIGELLATVVGQDLEETGDGTFRIARRVAKDRVISTVDPDARRAQGPVQQRPVHR